MSVIKTPSSVQSFTGAAAFNQLRKLMDFSDDSTGGVFACTLFPEPSTEALNPSDSSLHSNDNGESLKSRFPFGAMIVIDSGNKHGDSWKYIYHIHVQGGVMFIETDPFVPPDEPIEIDDLPYLSKRVDVVRKTCARGTFNIQARTDEEAITLVDEIIAASYRSTTNQVSTSPNECDDDDVQPNAFTDTSTDYEFVVL